MMRFFFYSVTSCAIIQQASRSYQRQKGEVAVSRRLDRARARRALFFAVTEPRRKSGGASAPVGARGKKKAAVRADKDGGVAPKKHVAEKSAAKNAPRRPLKQNGASQLYDRESRAQTDGLQRRQQREHTRGWHPPVEQAVVHMAPVGIER